MPPIFEINERRSEDGALLLALVGELDLATVPALSERLQRASASKDAVVLDLAELGFMDSTGLRLLLEATADSSRDGWNFAITNTPVAVLRLLELANVRDALPLIDG